MNFISIDSQSVTMKFRYEGAWIQSYPIEKSQNSRFGDKWLLDKYFCIILKTTCTCDTSTVLRISTELYKEMGIFYFTLYRNNVILIHSSQHI